MNKKLLLTAIWCLVGGALWYGVGMYQNQETETFDTQSYTKNISNSKLGGAIGSESDFSCPYELKIEDGFVYYTPSPDGRGGKYLVSDWAHKLSCIPKIGGEYDKIVIQSQINGNYNNHEIIDNPSNYHFEKSYQYRSYCMGYTGCRWDIEVVTWRIETWHRYDCVYTGSQAGSWLSKVCIEVPNGKYTDPMCNNECSIKTPPYCGDGICQPNEKDKYGNPICTLDCKWRVEPTEPKVPWGNWKMY